MAPVDGNDGAQVHGQAGIDASGAPVVQLIGEIDISNADADRRRSLERLIGERTVQSRHRPRRRSSSWTAPASRCCCARSRGADSVELRNPSRSCGASSSARASTTSSRSSNEHPPIEQTNTAERRYPRFGFRDQCGRFPTTRVRRIDMEDQVVQPNLTLTTERTEGRGGRHGQGRARRLLGAQPRRRGRRACSPTTSPISCSISPATKFLDSSGLRAILTAQRRLADRDGQLALRAPSESVRRLLDITGLTDHFVVES